MRTVSTPLDTARPQGRASSNKMARGAVLALLGGTLWGFSGTAASYLFTNSEISPIWIMSVRLICSGSLFLMLSRFRTPGNITALLSTKGNLRSLALFVIGGLFLNQFSYLNAIRLTNSATATILQCLQLLVIACYSCARGRRAPRTRELVGLALALGGTFLIATGGDPSRMSLPQDGLLFGLGAAVGGAGLAIFPKGILSAYGVPTVMGVAMLATGLCMAPMVPSWRACTAFDTSCWAVFIALVLLGTLTSYLCYMQGVKLLGSLKATMLATSEPISATLLSVLWMGVSFNPSDLAGFAAIVVMMLLVM